MKAVRVIHFTVVNKEGVEGGGIHVCIAGKLFTRISRGMARIGSFPVRHFFCASCPNGVAIKVI